MERLMYSVDEWLRFRSGESRVTLVAKAGLGCPLVLRGLRVAVCHQCASSSRKSTRSNIFPSSPWATSC